MKDKERNERLATEATEKNITAVEKLVREKKRCEI
jgi:hypothetical protein